MSPIPISTGGDMMGPVSNAISSERGIGSGGTVVVIPTNLTPKPGTEIEPLERNSPTSESELQQQQPSSSTTETNLPGGGEPPSPKHGYGTLIPNRVFVGGISTHTTEAELAGLFSKFGAVRGAKIILDRAGISKGYGFITFETEEEARRLFTAMNNRELPPIVHRDRRLNIAPAVKKQPIIRPGGGSSLYGSSSASTTVSPPPSLEPFYFPSATSNSLGTGGCGGEFLLPPPPPSMAGFSPHDFLYPQPHPFSPFFQSAAAAAATSPTASHHNHPGLGLGQALPGPNGSIIFLPLGGFSFQQPQQSYNPASVATSDLWNGVGAGSNLASFGLPLPPNPSHQFQSWPPRMHPHHHHYPGSMAPPSHGGGGSTTLTPSGAGSHSSTLHPTSSSSQHHHHQLNLSSLNHTSGHYGEHLGNNSAHDPLLYFSNALISSPH